MPGKTLLVQYLLSEPFLWLFFYCFQPSRFKREVEPGTLRGRILPSLRLMLPLFLCTYPIVVLSRTALCATLPTLYIACSAHHLNMNEAIFLFHTAIGSAEGLFAVLLGGICVDLIYGISLGVAIGVADGIATDQTIATVYSSQVGIVYGLAVGLSFGLLFGLVASSSGRNEKNSIPVSVLGASTGIISGIVGGLTFGYIGGVLVGFVGLASIHVLGTLVGSLTGGMIVNLLGVMLKNSMRRKNAASNSLNAITIGRTIGTAFGTCIGAVGGTVGIIAFNDSLLMRGITADLALGRTVSVAVGVSFLVSYASGYFRLPLYPISAGSTWSMFRRSCRLPDKVFHWLQHSALYWDERVFLPLPGLQQTLLLAVGVNAERAREELDFIVLERPEQISCVRDAIVEMTLRELEACTSLRRIIQFSYWFEDMFPLSTRTGDTRLVASLEYMKSASRNAARYFSPVSWQARQSALHEMVANLKKVHPNIVFEQEAFNRRLQTVVEQWLLIAQSEQEKLHIILDEVGSLPNPYISGQAILPRDTMFVGRRDLVQYLERVLNRSRYRPTIFLTGERRMGKSSTLNQLPYLLSSRYLTIIYDMQFRGKTSSASALLWYIADEIAHVLEAHSIHLKRLEYTALLEARKENEAAVYRLFDFWLKELEQVLEQEEYALILAFDEFEKLEEAGQQQHLALPLLLDWLRSTMQHSTRLTFLFSGVKSLDALGPQWAGYFVNVETLRVSFLRPSEAYHLITQPTPDFPSEQIFGAGVVEEIMRVTGCHPFLVQATCSKLIDLLNTDKQGCAELSDVARATDSVLEGWWATYFRDLWVRTSAEQRKCLTTLKEIESGTLQEIAQRCSLDKSIAREALTTLCQRDLLRCEHDRYEISAPIFLEWVERNS